MNEVYRWRGLRPDYVEEVDLVLITLGGSLRWHPKWTGFISVTSNVEADENIEPLRDRMVLTQGIQYRIRSRILLNLAGSVRLNQAKSDPLKTRAKNWRIFCGVVFGLSLSKTISQRSILNELNH